MLKVKMSTSGNPDFGQNPLCQVSPPLIKEIENLKEASAVVRAYIEEFDLGAGNCGFAQVFNGRVWDLKGFEIRVK